VFWPLLLNFEVSGVPKDSQVPISGAWVSFSYFPQSRVTTWCFFWYRLQHPTIIWFVIIWPIPNSFFQDSFTLCQSSLIFQASRGLTHLLFSFCLSVLVHLFLKTFYTIFHCNYDSWSVSCLRVCFHIFVLAKYSFSSSYGLLGSNPCHYGFSNINKLLTTSVSNFSFVSHTHYAYAFHILLVKLLKLFVAL